MTTFSGPDHSDKHYASAEDGLEVNPYRNEYATAHEPQYQTEKPRDALIEARPRGARLPFGLTSTRYTILVAGMTALIVGAAVGGGVGGSLSHKTTDCRYENLSSLTPPKGLG